jgi:hypothetical protein
LYGLSSLDAAGLWSSNIFQYLQISFNSKIQVAWKHKQVHFKNFIFIHLFTLLHFRTESTTEGCNIERFSTIVDEKLHLFELVILEKLFLLHQDLLQKFQIMFDAILTDAKKSRLLDNAFKLH